MSDDERNAFRTYAAAVLQAVVTATPQAASKHLDTEDIKAAAAKMVEAENEYVRKRKEARRPRREIVLGGGSGESAEE